MALQFDNRISWVDIFNLLSALIVGGYVVVGVVFGVEGEVRLQGLEIDHLKANIVRVEEQATQANNKIIEQLKEQNIEVRAIRSESAAEREKIIEKLDRLIERELGPRRNGQ